MSTFHAGPADLSHAHAVIDDFDAHLRADDRLATWAFATVDEPETERDLGQLADWCCAVTERRTS